MDDKITEKDIPVNAYGVPTDKRHLKMIHTQLISIPCKVCLASAGAECVGLSKGVHMGRVPDYWDSLHFLIAHLNGESYTPQNPFSNGK